MNVKQLLLYGFMFGLLSLTACGGGGGSSSLPTTATLKLSTSGTLPTGTSLAGIGITVTLPADVTVATNASGDVLSGGVIVSGIAAPGNAIAVYTPASGATPATLALTMVSTAKAGFGTGEFATISCDLHNGVSPKTSDFVLSDFRPFDLGGNPVIGLTPSELAMNIVNSF